MHKSNDLSDCPLDHWTAGNRGAVDLFKVVVWIAHVLCHLLSDIISEIDG